ncbi:MAG: hypothetical protein ACKV19_17255 [Verrucomicrobiales bacterium]
MTVTQCPAYLIALPERREAAEARLRSLGWAALEVVCASVPGYPIGPSLAHLETVERGLIAGRYPFVIFEDDAWPTPDFREVEIPISLQPDALWLSQEMTASKGGEHGALSRWRDAGGPYVQLINMLGLYAQVVCTEKFAMAYHDAALTAARADLGVDLLTAQLMKHYRVLGLWEPIIFQGPEGGNHNEWSSRHRLPRTPVADDAAGPVYGWTAWP